MVRKTGRVRVVPTNGGGRRTRGMLGLALAGAVVAGLTTGCSMADATCGGEEYPVLAVGSSGSACVPKGEEPPKGYTRYPEGKVPEHVGDKWDEYWNTRTVDKDGRIVRLKDVE